MQIANGLLLDENFNKALDTLSKKEMSVTQCLEFIEAIESANSRSVSVQTARKALILKSCCKDEKGEPVEDGDGEIKFPSLEAKNKCLEEINTLMNEPYGFPIKEKVKISKSEKFTPKYLALVRNLVEIVD